MRRISLAGLIGVLLAVLLACSDGGAERTPIGEVTRPDLVGLIDWERTKDTVVFRAEVMGGATDPFYLRNEVPLCTIYGDNRVVWTTSGATPDDGVAWDYVSDEAIRLFVEDLTINEEIYNFTSGIDQLEEGETAPVTERITLFVNGILHQADGLGGWNYDYFRRVVSKCRGISGSPVEFVPQAGWVSAREVEFLPDQPSIRWDGDISGIRLSQIARSGERTWVEGRYVPVIWEVLRRHGFSLQFEDTDGVFEVALEVPDFTRDSPPAR